MNGILARGTVGSGTSELAPLLGSNWYSVTYGNGVFVAVAYNGTAAAYSTNGINWSASTLPSSAGWWSVTYGNGVFVAVGSDGKICKLTFASSVIYTTPTNKTFNGKLILSDGSFQFNIVSKNVIARVNGQAYLLSDRYFKSSDTATAAYATSFVGNTNLTSNSVMLPMLLGSGQQLEITGPEIQYTLMGYEE